MIRVAASVRVRRSRLPGSVGSTRTPQHERSGVLLTLRDAQGNEGYGEASPLPGFSLDDIGTSCDALEPLVRTGLHLADDPAQAWSELQRLGSRVPRESAAARFAVETAVLDLLGRRHGVPAWSLLDDEATNPGVLPLASLVQTSSENALLESARAALERGVTTLKVKLGFAEPAEQARQLRVLRARIGDGISIRLDANATWSVAEAPDRLAELVFVAPEFLEQPVMPRDLPALSGSPLALALDEALLELSSGELQSALDRLPIAALILKPMALGGVVRCLELWRWARARGIDVVVTHLFDGPVALAATAALALVIGSPGRAMGLDAHPGLSAWPAAGLPMLQGATLATVDRPGLGIELGAEWKDDWQ